MSSTDPITDYTQTQRIVLLIDLNPLLHLQNHHSYLTTLLSLSKTLLSFASLSSSSLFSFKPFFSSLSPLLSSSKLPFCSLSLSFNDAASTLESLSGSLASIANAIEKTSGSSNSSAWASNVAASMRQLVHEYVWDLNSIDSGEFSNAGSVLNSNLVVLFSPICRNTKWVCDFMDVEIDDECLRDVGVFKRKFNGVFESVNDAFVRRDIHFSWVDVKYELNNEEEIVIDDGSELAFGFFESGIKGLGWGYCSSDSIVLGSALVPFGLIYPRIGISSNSFDVDDCLKRVSVQLSLGILDVNGKPLDCKMCDLELVDMNMSSQRGCNIDVLITPGFMNPNIKGREQKKAFWGRFGDKITKFHVNAVQRCEEFDKFKGQLSHPILVRESLGSLRKDQKESFGEFYADRVLEILAKDMGEFGKRKSIPIWPIILSFLYREDYWASVSLSNDGDDSCIGILKPFTVSSALLFVTEDKFFSYNGIYEISVSTAAQFNAQTDNEICKLNVDSQSAPSSSKRKRNKENLYLHKDLTWSAFCEAAFEHSRMHLEEVYYRRGCNESKKMKFLKCWIKQIEKSGCHKLTMPEGSKPQQDISKEVDNRLTESPQESEQPIPSSASTGEDCLSGASRIQDNGAVCFHTETLESFFDDLPAKIHQGLQTKGVDLRALAERLVSSSIYWLYQKREVEINSQKQTPVTNSNGACDSMITHELTRLLLRKPKDLVVMHKKSDPSSQTSDPGPQGSTSEDIVREYELQILFRMEILQSEAGATIEEPMKQKFLKQICFLLEAVQCHLEVGFFGDWSLESYVGKIIKSRYCHTLGDVVSRIYTKMDLLLFADEEDESPSHLLNSEESKQSWKEKEKRSETGGNFKLDESILVHEETLQAEENIDESPRGNKRKESAYKLIEAQGRRERARRFSSFTSWMPDLQRVWAPKQPKVMKPKSDFLRKPSKRKDRRKTTCDRVCETPMTGNKRSCSRGNRIDDEDHHHYGSQSGGSVTKALFQDDI